MSDHNYSKVDLNVDLLNEMNYQVELIIVKALRNSVRSGITYSQAVKQNQPSTKTKLSTTTSTKSKDVYTTTNPGKMPTTTKRTVSNQQKYHTVHNILK